MIVLVQFFVPLVGAACGVFIGLALFDWIETRTINRKRARYRGN